MGTCTCSCFNLFDHRFFQWAHSFNLACHRGVLRTFSLLKQQFWCPSISSDTHEFVLACSVCAHSKVSSSYSGGSLMTTSSPLQTLGLYRPCCSHVFRLNGIHDDIISERGPQHASQVWKVSCEALGASVSLSSGFHLQTNGQTEQQNKDMELAVRLVTPLLACSPPLDWVHTQLW